MFWHEVKKIALVFSLSTVKFGFGGVPWAVFEHWPFFKAITITTAGAVTGSILFANISEWVLGNWRKFRQKYLPYKKHKHPEDLPGGKFAHKVMEKWGLPGIAFFSPVFLSIPIGTMLAVRFYHDKQKIISYMLISIVFWDVVLFTLYNHFYNFMYHFLHHVSI